MDNDEDKAEGEEDYGNERIIMMKTWMIMAIIMKGDLTFFRFCDKAMTMTEDNDASFDDGYYYYCCFGSTAFCRA
jgi:hypothetical protein